MGTLETKTLAVIERRFPHIRAVVQREFTGSEGFRGLCRDYVACETALTRWQEADTEEGRLRAQEYSDLLAELTTEIEAHLHADGS